MSSPTHGLLHLPRKLQVCILTYKRPGMLADAIASVHAQTGVDELGIKLHLLVVDPAGRRRARHVRLLGRQERHQGAALSRR